MLSDGFVNFQKGLMGSPRCKGCYRKCVVLYDGHHDEYFSLTCGKVIMEMGVFCLSYDVDFDKVFEEYEVRFKRHRERRELLERRRLGFV